PWIAWCNSTKPKATSSRPASGNKNSPSSRKPKPKRSPLSHNRKMNDVTQILDRVRQGDSLAASELLPLVYEELRRIAAHKMGGDRAGNALHPTALVHEAWLGWVEKAGRAQFQTRAYFLGAAAEAMRRFLIDRARRKQAQKHGAGRERLDVDDVEI